eukprot:137412-Heterocapsa_arctica.AAC.1
MLFRFEWMRQEQQRGALVNPASAASWNASREAYSALTQAEKDRFELAAAQSKDIARKARRELQDRRQQQQQQ